MTGRNRPERTSRQREILANAASLALFPLGLSPVPLHSVFGVIPAARNAQVRSIPVVVIHGWGANMSLNVRIHARLRQAGFLRVHSLNYLSFGSEGASSAARTLVKFIDEVRQSTGSKEVHLVAHSAGGIVVREAICRQGLTDVVSVITIASPHKGSAYGHLGLLLAGQGPLKFAAQMRSGSRYLRDLDKETLPEGTEWFAYQGGIDTIVTPQSAVLDKDGVTNILFPQEGHISLMLSRDVVNTVAENLIAAEERHLTRTREEH